MDRYKTISLIVTASTLLLIGTAIQASVHYLDRDFAAFATHYSVKPMTAAELALECQQDAEQRRAMAGGEFYDQLSRYVSYTGVSNPYFVTSDKSKLSKDDFVVGIVHEGQAFAFPLDLLAHPKRHVVNFAIFGSALSVSYCNLSGCIRVFRREGEASIPLGIGGLDIHQEMVLMLNGMRYSQDSKHIPLADFPFKKTTWGEWIDGHPNSKLFVAPDTD